LAEDQGQNTIIRLQSLTKAFTKSELKVADMVLSQKDSVIYMSVTDLAEQAGVGDTTVLRFCRKLGFKGYQDFKLALAKGMVQPMKNLHQEVTEDDEPIAIARKVTETNLQAITDTLSITEPKNLEKAVTALKALLIAGLGCDNYGYQTMGVRYRYRRNENTFRAC
jgi:DNA-binding MurR/RpiR family transcriptional regulator